MVIQCTQCDTRFRIADEKVKPGGIKVRCSKCRHIFSVMPPEPKKPAQEAAGEDDIDFGAFNMKPVPEEPGAAKSNTELDRTGREMSEETGSSETGFEAKSAGDEASELHFGEEPSARREPSELDFEEKPAAEQGPSEFDFEEESAAERESSEFTFEEESFPEEESSEFTFEEGPLREDPSEFDFGEDPCTKQSPVEFDFGDETAPEQGTVEFGFEDETADGSADFSFEDDPFSESGSEDAETMETGAGAREDFDFGDESGQSVGTDDFDLSGMSFGDEEPSSAGPGAGLDTIPMEQAPEIDEIPAVEARPKKSGESGRDGQKSAAPPSAPRRKTPFRGVLVFVLVLLLALCGVAGYFFWQGGNLDIVKIVEQLTGQGKPASATGQIRLSELSSSFATNREAGQLFVIRGKATNEYSETRSAIAVKGILYNDGQPLLQQTVFCGNSLSAEDLRTMPFAKIEESMNNQFGDSLSNLNVAPGKSIPFTIVFKNLPPQLAEYTVEAVDSKPGSKP